MTSIGKRIAAEHYSQIEQYAITEVMTSHEAELAMMIDEALLSVGGAEAIRNVMHHSPEKRAELLEKFERHWAANRELIARLNAGPSKVKE